MMKKITIIFALVLGVGMVYGQSSNLKGPAAKNYKPWKNQQKVTLVDTKTDQVQGPQAKNQKIWENNDNQQAVYVATTTRRHLKGPKAKNYRAHVEHVPAVPSRLAIAEEKDRSIRVVESDR